MIEAFLVTSSNIFGIKKRTIIMAIGVILSIILAGSDIYKMLVDYLIILGTFIPPIGGIIICDYWWHCKGKFPAGDKRQPEFNWAGIVAYVMASAIAYFSSGIKPINGIFVAMVIYFVLSKIIPFISRRLKVS